MLKLERQYVLTEMEIQPRESGPEPEGARSRNEAVVASRERVSSPENWGYRDQGVLELE